MTQPPGTRIEVKLTGTEIVLAEGGVFEVRLSPAAFNAGLSLVIDAYDMDNAVHPEGHLGWWQAALDRTTPGFRGKLQTYGAELNCELHGVSFRQSWVNDKRVDFNRLVVHAVLRAEITNAIVDQDKLPAFRTRQDLEHYRSGFNRDWRTPRYALPSYILPRKSTVRIVSRNIYRRDAVGNLCLEFFRLLRQNNIDVEMYAENADLAINDLVSRYRQLVLDAVPEDQVVYFYSVYDPDLETLLDLPFNRRAVYFHGVPDPQLLQVFDPELSVGCLRGYAQLPLLEAFDVISANSKASAQKLLSNLKKSSRWRLEDIQIIPPRLLPTPSPVSIVTAAEGQPTRILYVGRIKSHKKIEHLLEFFAEYLKLDPSAELWIVGGGADKPYWDYLQWMETRQLVLPEGKVHWVGSVGDEELAERYASASAYVSMSEDEGFCLPIFEAMLAGLPVLAYGLPAVREVMRDTGIFFQEKDFSHLTSVLFNVLSDRARISEIVEKQRERASELAKAMDGRLLLTLLRPSYEQQVADQQRV